MWQQILQTYQNHRDWFHRGDFIENFIEGINRKLSYIDLWIFCFLKDPVGEIWMCSGRGDTWGKRMGTIKRKLLSCVHARKGTDCLEREGQEENDGREWIFLLLPVHMDFAEGNKDLKEFGFLRPGETQLWHQICGKRGICNVKEEVFNSCQGGVEQEILGFSSPQGLVCNYFMFCQFVRTGVCFPSRERRQQIGICMETVLWEINYFYFMIQLQAKEFFVCNY